MKTLGCISFLTLLFLFSEESFSQSSYPQGYFRNPLDIPIQLVANFGELRPNHFHMGLDIRTQGRENLPVYAAADGYVSRIKIEKLGYGNAIYINHPNGYTTLYAHLNTFFPALAEYIKSKQYREQKWAQDFELPAGLFPVKKGQLISMSGNTGGSAGPHLHFEIRDTRTGNNLNPLLFGFNISDRQPPVIKGLYWYDRRFSTYLLPAKQVPLVKKNSSYTAVGKVVEISSPLLSFGISAMDISNSSGFNLGIYSAELFIDGSLVNSFTLKNFSYTDTRYVNACIDFTKLIKERKYIQHLAILPGNGLDIFSHAGNGLITLTDTLEHAIRINVRDAYNNLATLNFIIKLSGSLNEYPVPANVTALLPTRENVITGNNVKALFSKNTFYDVVPFVLKETKNTNKNSASVLSGLYNYTVPLHDSFTVELKSTLAANNPLRKNVVMQLTSGSDKQTMKGKWTSDWMSARFNALGNVQLLIDTVPPTITPVGWKNGSVLSAAKTLILKCRDDIAKIDSFRAELDGRWLLFAARGDNFIYTFDEHCPKGTHTLTVLATDIAGNTTNKTYAFTR